MNDNFVVTMCPCDNPKCTGINIIWGLEQPTEYVWVFISFVYDDAGYLDLDVLYEQVTEVVHDEPLIDRAIISDLYQRVADAARQKILSSSTSNVSADRVN